ncbi:MAG: chemotaxis protein CheW [Gammaproteobacteria bacterium]|nr:chemotaxis protein CheW [Gammaproteobacteria bacterium]
MKTAEEISSVVRTQLLPLSGMNLVLPNTCIAEVINLQPIEPIADAPQWLLGMTSWRGVNIPVISFEQANGADPDAPSRTTRIAVLNSSEAGTELPFYGLLTQGIPKLLAVQKADINSVAKPATKLPLARQQTLINDVAAVIPDQQKIESLLKKQGVTAN